MLSAVCADRAPRGFDAVYYGAYSSSTQRACSTAFIYMEESVVIEAGTHKDLLQRGGCTKAQGFASYQAAGDKIDLSLSGYLIASPGGLRERRDAPLDSNSESPHRRGRDLSLRCFSHYYLALHHRILFTIRQESLWTSPPLRLPQSLRPQVRIANLRGSGCRFAGGPCSAAECNLADWETRILEKLAGRRRSAVRAVHSCL